MNNPSISTPSISSSSDVSSFDSATAIPEITSVELSDNGMTAINDVPKITNEVSSEQPVLEITDDDDDDGVSDFGPDFS